MAMSPEQAESTLIQLKTLKELGGIEHMGVDAVNGDLRTASLDVYMSWLAERASSVAAPSAAKSRVMTSAIVDVKV
ncbi:hypothetical protein CSW59_20065 [Caulobacter sp. BP25]|nr:hypothetical protein CSW59_20065 [Caulobacter sp. BP25]